MADNPNPNPDQPKPLDPFVESLVKSTGQVLEPEPKPDNSTAIGGAETDLRPIVTLGEAMAEAKRTRKTPEQLAKDKEAEEAKKLAADEEAKKKEAAEKAKGQQPPQPDPKRPQVIKKPLPPPLPDLPPAPIVQLAEPDQGDQDYIATLEPEQQEVIELARFAEAKGKKGILKQTIEHFRAVDRYVEEHPDVDPEGEDFAKAIATTQPKWTEGERRRLERQMISEQAAENARRSLDPILQEQNRQLRSISVSPMIESDIASMSASMTEKQGDLEPVDKAVIECIEKEGYETAARKHRVEAPIIKFSRDAARAWLEVRRGVRKLDPENETDAWLIQFINTQGQIMAARPEAERSFNGRQFLPMNQFAAEIRKDPNAANRFWTFSDGMIMDMIGNSAVLKINEEYKLLAESGFERKKVSPGDGKPAPGGGDQKEGLTGSPRAGGKGIPGAADNLDITEEELEREKFMDSLVPGISKELKKK